MEYDTIGGAVDERRWNRAEGSERLGVDTVRSRPPLRRGQIALALALVAVAVLGGAGSVYAGASHGVIAADTVLASSVASSVHDTATGGALAAASTNETDSSSGDVDETGPTVESIVAYDSSTVEVVFSEPVTLESVDELEVTRGVADEQGTFVTPPVDHDGERLLVIRVGSDVVFPHEPITIDFGTVESQRGHTTDVGNVSVTVTSATIANDGSDDSPENARDVFQGEELAVVADAGGPVEVTAVDDSNGSSTSLDPGPGSVATFDTSGVDDGTTLAFSFADGDEDGEGDVGEGDIGENRTEYVTVRESNVDVRIYDTELTVNDEIDLYLSWSDWETAFPVALLDEDGDVLEESYTYACQTECSGPDHSIEPPGPGHYTVAVTNPVIGVTETVDVTVEYLGPELEPAAFEVFGTITLPFTEPLERESTTVRALRIDGEPSDNDTLEYDGDDQIDIVTDREFGSDVDVAVDADVTAAETGKTNPIRNESVRVCAQANPPTVVGPALPQTTIPQDLDDDGLYEDVNGDGASTTDDVVALFEHLEDDAVQYYACKYDFSGDQRVTITDLFWLFNAV